MREAIANHTGSIDRVEHATAGSVGDFAAALTTADGGVFCKGARADTDRVGFLRNEIRVNRHLPADVAPRLRWHLEKNGWLIAAFDRATGRSADLRPGSPDLPVVAGALTRMAAALTPCPPITIQPAAARWGGLLDPVLLRGDTLLHTDMTHHNFIVDGDRVQVVDWSMPCRGPAWLDAARMLVRLIRAGHTPAQAEIWAAQLPTWADISPDAVDAFAAALAKLARRLRDDNTGAPHLAEMADASRAWLRHRRHGPR
ncbi:phosphotransferase [Actinoplanes sp. TBRC 11911]|uniref:phosphotransferase n=1 Tax=Actinoplanes sp. TBRC 11911 TaxID=2729386 RepID=UPI0028983456|nr:phosphotransferase [Actinoplanes sp. TBRC 11911]